MNVKHSFLKSEHNNYVFIFILQSFFMGLEIIGTRMEQIEIEISCKLQN